MVFLSCSGGSNGRMFMQVLLSITIWVVGAILTAAAFFAAWLIKVAPFPIKDREKLVHAQNFWWSDALVALNPFWSLEVKGLEHIDPGETYVIVANHQSLADIILMYQTRMHFKWVAKKELLKVPFIGGLLWVNDHVLISRGDFSSIKEVYRKAAERLRSGISMLFFPEGTRSDTDEMGEFQNGAFKLAIREHKKLLPVYVGGTREAIPKGGWIFNTKVNARLIILPPIDTSAYQAGDFGRLSNRAREELQKAALQSG